jgi:hypothetical protein
MLHEQREDVIPTLQERHEAAFYRDAERDHGTQQVGAEAKGQWYLIRCEPGRDITAQKWLASRKFGTFLPMNGLKRVLPGWLCAYVFDMEAMRDRILSFPGVVGILRCHKKLPHVIDAAFIQHLAREAWMGKALPPARKTAPVKRLHKRDRKALRKAKQAMKRAKLSGSLDTVAQISAFRSQMLRQRGAA